MKYVLALSLLFSLSLAFAGLCQAQTASPKAGDKVKIRLTIGGKVIDAVLFNTAPARDLLSKLPLTVTLNRGPVDYCGGVSPIKHEKSDLQSGYRGGDLAYWIPGRDFVIFTADKKDSSGSPDLVILGKVLSDLKEVKALGDVIKVTISLDR